MEFPGVSKIIIFLAKVKNGTSFVLDLKYHTSFPIGNS